RETVYLLTDEERSVTGVLDSDLAQHLAYDDLNVLIIDTHTLEAIHLLHLIHEIFLEFSRAEYAQDIVRIHRTVHERLSSGYPVSFVDIHVFALRNQILLLVPHPVFHENTAHAFYEPTKLHRSVDFADNGLFFGFSRLEKLGNPRETAGNIFRFRGLAWNLNENVARKYFVALVHKNMRTRRQQVSRNHVAARQFSRLAVLVFD